MTEKDDYVAPPQKETKEDYITPPKAQKETKYVKPPQEKITTQENFQEEKAAPKRQEAEEIVYPKQSTQTSPVDGYFSTPKMGMKFYLTGYLIFMGLYSLSSFLNNGFHFTWLLGVGYILLSNYTLSWFSDYQRAKGGSFAWFFTPYGSVKVSALSSGAMNFQKGTVKKDWTGNYKTSSRTDFGSHLWMFVIMTIIIEFLKLIVNVPLAFITIFLHKQTMDNYRKLVK